MNIIKSSIHAYQKQQSLAEWVNKADQNQAVEEDSAAHLNWQDDQVVLGEDHAIVRWLAEQHAIQATTAAEIGRLNQALFEYDMLSLADVDLVNTLIADQPGVSVAALTQAALAEQPSYQQSLRLENVTRVYANLTAATQQ